MNLQPPAVLNMGAPGSGKTYSLVTLLRAELKVFVICTEPDGLSSLLDACEAQRVPIHNLHWVVCQPTSAGWSAMKEMATTISTLGYEEIAKIKTGVGKLKTREAAMKFLDSCENFICERTGENFGDITQLGDDCAVVLDSLSGLNMISMMAAQGHKPAAHQGEWGVAMNFIENLILKLTSDRKAFFILNAHIEKEDNLISGASQIMASTLGKKVAPKLPRFFSEVIYSKRTLTEDKKPIFLWSTADSAADLKNRTLPVATAIIPDYGPIVEAYRKRKALAAAIPPTPAKQTEARPGLVPPAAPMKPAA